MMTGSETLRSSGKNCIERNEMQAKVLQAFFYLICWAGELDLARRNWWGLTNAKGKSISVPFWDGRFLFIIRCDGICIYERFAFSCSGAFKLYGRRVALDLEREKRSLGGRRIKRGFVDSGEAL